jgi:hypothetical protein
MPRVERVLSAKGSPLADSIFRIKMPATTALRVYNRPVELGFPKLHRILSCESLRCPNSTIAAQVTQETILDARQASRNASAETIETRIFNSLPELADFDGFSDSNEAGRMHEISITRHGPLSTARSSTMVGWSSKAPLMAPRRDQNEHQRPRALLLGLNSPSTTTPQSTRLFNHELSSHNSLDSSSLCSLDIPIVERAHTLCERTRAW